MKRICPICKCAMKGLPMFGRLNVDWYCVNPVCGLPAKTCPKCNTQVLPQAIGLGPAQYHCECGEHLT